MAKIKLISGGSNARGNFEDARKKDPAPKKSPPKRQSNNITDTSPVVANLPKNKRSSSPQNPAPSSQTTSSLDGGQVEELMQEPGSDEFVDLNNPIEDSDFVPRDFSGDDRFRSFKPQNDDRTVLKQIWDYYSPVIPLALMESGAFSALAQSAKTVIAKISTGNVAKGAAQVGKLTPEVNSASAMAVNSVTTKATSSVVAKLLKRYGKPAALVGAITATVGSIAWNGHLKLDNLIGGYNIAIGDAFRSGNNEEGLIAVEAMEQYLDQSLWEKIIDFIPGINVAKTTYVDGISQGIFQKDIYKKMIENAIFQEENEESEADYYQRVNDERRAEELKQREEDALYYAEIARQQAAAKEAERAADAKYYAKILADREKEQARKQKEQDDYWSAYWRTRDELKTDTGPTSSGKSTYEPPSNLKFGLL